MKHQHITAPQIVNACTLISIATIEAILNAKNDEYMYRALVAAQDMSQQRYKKLIASSPQDHGEGLLEEDAYQQFYATAFKRPHQEQLNSPVSLESITTLLGNRDNMMLDEWDETIFQTFNFDAIEAVQKLLPIDTPAIDWQTITKEKLIKLVNPVKKPELSLQVKEVISNLQDPEGITLRMEGHTISVAKRKGVYYSYDSLTGDLSSTAVLNEMTEHIAHKVTTNRANTLIVNHFFPVPPFPQAKFINQNCAEIMLKKAAQLVLKQDLDFIYDREIPDVQVDISPAFLFTEDRQKQFWNSGASKELLEADLKRLNKDKVYFLRTGTNDGAGHWQTLYFDTTRKGWINYSSDKNNYLLTQNDMLTVDGEMLLSPFAKWGTKAGEYAFLLVEASPKNLIQSSNFLYNFRMDGEEKAMEKAIEQREILYDEIQVKVYHPPVKVDEELDEVIKEPVKEFEKPKIGTDPVDHKTISVKPNLTPGQELATKLNHIIDQLVANIANQDNGRRTTRNNDWKIGLFINIKKQLNSKELSPIEV
ncbi:hypothetical protein [Legionella sp.]|uniref:hypothetical protein n=1 Tax=Legionella sp. TaxID=459 RepID=UPI003C948CAF